MFLTIIEQIHDLNAKINSLVWGAPMLILIIGTGIYFTLRTDFFQFSKIKLIASSTFLAIFKDKSVRKTNSKHAISQFQTMATALAGTIGTGNIAGVATAITIGGAGAIFWMWVSAIFGMMTGFSENVLGIYYRKKDKDGYLLGGPMYYLEEGLKNNRFLRFLSKPLALAFAFFCLCASFGIGNMTQANTISTSLESSFGINSLATGIAVSVLCASVIIGGIKRIAAVTERLVPVMAVIQFILTLLVCISNYKNLSATLTSIFNEAFGITALAGGLSGGMVKSMTIGLKRGVFSNEAGLGSSVLAHTSADDDEPVNQGMWSIFEIFFDTIISCSLTAFALLSSGVTGSKSANGELIDGAPLVSLAFSKTFGANSGAIVSVLVLFFAFSTLLSWSIYGTKVTEYLFGKKAILPYKILFAIFIVVGCTMELRLVWDISDTLNGLMAIPNLIGVLALSGTVIRVTKNFLSRKKNSSLDKPIKPIISYYDK